jgi:hypothetical protein
MLDVGKAGAGVQVCRCAGVQVCRCAGAAAGTRWLWPVDCGAVGGGEAALHMVTSHTALLHAAGRQ